MSSRFRQHLARYRAARGWSQQDLAHRSGLSRAAISAIETGRVIPSTAAALALARTIGCLVEDLFDIGAASTPASVWASDRPADRWPFWRAALGARTVCYPAEHTAAGWLPAHAMASADGEEDRDDSDPTRVLVIAGCDPAAGLLRAELHESAGVQVLPLIRSSRHALDLLRLGLVHVAGLHLNAASPDGNAAAVRAQLGTGYTLLRLTRWQEGVAFARHLRLPTIAAAVAAKIRWIAREVGSGARECLDALFAGQHVARRFTHVASDHLGIVAAIRAGSADAGIVVRLCAAEAGLGFLAVREEDYDLCYRSDLHDDPRIAALRTGVQSRRLRRQLADLPGYRADTTGTLVHLDA